MIICITLNQDKEISNSEDQKICLTRICYIFVFKQNFQRVAEYLDLELRFTLSPETGLHSGLCFRHCISSQIGLENEISEFLLILCAYKFRPLTFFIQCLDNPILEQTRARLTSQCSSLPYSNLIQHITTQAMQNSFK